MACFSGTIRSRTLNMDTGLCVVLPYDSTAQMQQKPCKVLYLLHGIKGCSTSWLRNTNVERYAQQYGVALVMPEVQRSFYLNLKYGLPYFDYVAKELPELVCSLFQISPRREDTFVAGLSMGGYGAMLCALTYPQRYAGAASFSGAVDLGYALRNFGDEASVPEWQGALGPALALPPAFDLFHLADALAKKPVQQHPKLFATCGTEDFLHSSNLDFAAHMQQNGIGYDYREWPGSHTWDFWDESVRHALKAFF